MRIEKLKNSTINLLNENKAPHVNEAMPTFGWKLNFLHKNKAKMAKNLPPSKEEIVIEDTFEYAGWLDVSQYEAKKLGWFKIKKNKKKKP